MAENLSNQSVPEAAARVAAVVNRLVNRIGSNAESKERLAEIEIPEELRDNLALFLRLERRVLSEYDPEIADLFDKILTAEIVANAGNPGTRAADESVDEQGVPTADEPTAVAFREVVDLIDSLPLDKQQVIVRAFTSFFHLANLSEENYRVAQLREREAGASTDTEVDPANELTVAYHQLVNEMGVEGANELLDKLEFHPVFTAHPTEARRKQVDGDEGQQLQQILPTVAGRLPDGRHDAHRPGKIVDALPPAEQVREGGKNDAPVVQHTVAGLPQHVAGRLGQPVHGKAQAHVHLPGFVRPGVELHIRQLHGLAVPQYGKVSPVLLGAHQLIDDIVGHEAAPAVHRNDLVPRLQAGLAAEGTVLHGIDHLAGQRGALGREQDQQHHEPQIGRAHV